ncbi:MAG TPA: DUF502 domain-containing protein [Thermoanaerobaculia bacterium]|nr:DUF502 domain-containing protein [Thermoanaerobaculia bacterium]
MTLRVRRHLTAGVLLIVPVAVTVAVLRFLFGLLDGWFQPVAAALFGREIPGLGVLLTVVLVWITGVLSTNFAGKKLLELFDRLLENLPLVKTVYSASKQLVEAVSPGGRRAFRRVVLVEFPKKGTFALGFVTGDGVGPLPGDTLSIYVPTALNPTSGFLVFARESDILDPRLTVEEGVKLVVSGGVVRPPGN